MGTRWGHRPLGNGWWLAALVVPVALAALVVVVEGDDLEADLGDRVRAALGDSGIAEVDIAGVDITVDGRDVTVSGLPPGSNTGAVEHRVAEVEGVADVEVEPPGVLGTGTCADAQQRIDRILGRNKVRFAPDSARLLGAERRQVVRIGGMLRRCAASVTVRGNVADPQEEAVDPLSQRRAEVVARVLRKQGGVVDAAVGGAGPEPIGGTVDHYVSIEIS